MADLHPGRTRRFKSVNFSLTCRLGPLPAARKYVDGDGMYVRKDKGDMILCEYTCKPGQTDKVSYIRLCVGAGNFNKQNPTTD
ncbi:BZ3500_MvSof-1268-A1-R1_Chr3-1g05696 [Microbotryum saponariae]|uniref:BZ3500_MvSof-1268-A1-R1_Chr2-1g04320 protein n=1 Tax=Microbotryum saponariae TaxID=289078 RepID=A0A2X0NH45_9BASI|nr:BZ3500_MvSof-1268-A1-R1_Chr2-1g04320 [Microbotryum saponariae]SCZ91425.1 BZ3501_MvSof-1269-A2-R1_Chr2-1g03976 [Microbotryum saponariae]SCZ98902.1 BZ3500_MvSof-1268-A1-R1_Chr3-1g05696 [Microbotryum saponariae]SDA04886.1 BZ3501_MvSof-1269-A2-R1_Chr3-1g05366 [Microbotryum saponariae]